LRILDRYLYKELLATFFAVLSVLLLIVFGLEATKLLTMAVEGRIHASIIFEILLLKLPATLEVVLPLVALLSVMLALGRLYQDQEMVVLASCGVPQRYFQVRVLWFLTPIVLLTAWVSLFVTPWSVEQSRLITKQAQETAPFAGLVSGKFNVLPNAQGVIYAESIDNENAMKNIWLKLNRPDKELSITAPNGRFEMVEDRMALVLMNGQSYEGLSAGDEVTIRQFERFEGFLPELDVPIAKLNRFGTPTEVLWQQPTLAHIALLEWRLALPFSVLVMGLIGLKMSKTKPREGRFSKIFIALAIYVVYNQLMISGRESIQNGHLDPFIGLWPIPLLFLWFALYQHSPQAEKKPQTKRQGATS